MFLIIVVANPPYSVSGFLNTLKNGKEGFDLFEFLTDKSSEIECLFIERTKQLLKEDGVAGIILPISILTNSGIYERTREILFKNFIFKAIVSLGSNAFMATGTRTIIVFIQKRSISDFKDITEQVDKFFASGFVDVAVGGIKDAFSTYVKNIYKDLSFDQYCKALKGDKIKHEIVKEYQNLNLEQIKELEKQKLIYFMLIYPQKIILAESGEKDTEKMFYGFEFSNRRGREGIHLHTDEEYHLKSKLYSETNLTDKEKLNTYILKAFEEDENLKSEIDIIQASENHPLKDHINYLWLFNLMTFDLNRFDKSINLNKKNNLKIENKWELVKLGEISSISSGNSAPQDKKYFQNNAYLPFIRAGNLNNVDSFGFIKPDENSLINQNAVKDLKLNKFAANCILFPKSGRSISTNNIGLLKEDSYVVNHLAVLSIEQEVTRKYIYQILKSIGISKIAKNQSDYLSMSIEEINSFKVPLPSLEIQSKIVSEIAEIEISESKVKEESNKAQDKINKLFNFKESFVRIGDVLTLKYGKSLPSKDRKKGEYPVCGSNGIDGYHNEYLINGPVIIVGRKGSAGKVNWMEQNCTPIDTTFYVETIPIKINLRYAFYILKNANLESLAKGIGTPGLNINDVYNVLINLPSLKEQETIITKIEPIEKKIEQIEAFLKNINKKKKEILDKYLV
jgi:type I restriction enzyme M protein